MKTPLKTFTGLKGVCAFGKIGKVTFAIIAKTPRELSALWDQVMAAAGPLDTAGIKRAILIEASTLPTPTGSHPSAQGLAQNATLSSTTNKSQNPEGVQS
jgi:hypothetical protein